MLLYIGNGIITISTFAKNYYKTIHTLVWGEARNYERTAGNPTGLQNFLQEGRQVKNVFEMHAILP
jgi:hypothetical protein